MNAVLQYIYHSFYAFFSRDNVGLPGTVVLSPGLVTMVMPLLCMNALDDGCT